MTAPVCNAPVQGGCDKPSTQVILHRAGENMIGNGMAVWSAYYRCGSVHSADTEAALLKRADPEATVLVFMSETPLEPGEYLAMQVVRPRP